MVIAWKIFICITKGRVHRTIALWAVILFMDFISNIDIHSSPLDIKALKNCFCSVLDRCPDGTVYIVMCFCCRVVEALGCSAFVTALFAITASVFPNSVSTVVVSIESIHQSVSLNILDLLNCQPYGLDLLYRDVFLLLCG